MKKIILTIIILLIGHLVLQSQNIYVDSNTGNDRNSGTKEAPLYSVRKAMDIVKSRDNHFYVIKINPGIYILDNHVRVATEKELTDKRIVIEASILPGDSSWTPEKMPVILTESKKGEITEYGEPRKQVIVSFLIEASHVTIRGVKFPGYPYPNNRYFPIARFNKKVTDLLVEQCLFAGDQQSSVIQVGVLGHGNQIKINHCIFYEANNAAVFWEDSGSGSKTGNSMTNCIVYGAAEAAIWTVAPDIDFVFNNNIVTNCNFVWIRVPKVNKTKYSINNCIFVKNQNYQGDDKMTPQEYKVDEKDVIKKGDLSLRKIKSVFAPLPIDHLHVLPDSPGYSIGAGLFKTK